MGHRIDARSSRSKTNPQLSPCRTTSNQGLASVAVAQGGGFVRKTELLELVRKTKEASSFLALIDAKMHD